MFRGEDAALPAAEVERHAAAGAHAFLAAYGRPTFRGAETADRLIKKHRRDW
jgi:hypothetical protein